MEAWVDSMLKKRNLIGILHWDTSEITEMHGRYINKLLRIGLVRILRLSNVSKDLTELFFSTSIRKLTLLIGSCQVQDYFLTSLSKFIEGCKTLDSNSLCVCCRRTALGTSSCLMCQNWIGLFES